MTPEEEKSKKDMFEETLFKKNWAKYLKLSPILSKIKKNVGRGPKCNQKTSEIKVAVDTKVGSNKKKK